MDSGRPRLPDRLERARVQGAVLPDERAVEVARDDGDLAREAGWQEQAQPLRALTTYAATSAICCSLSEPLKGGIPPPPFVT
jgi:hypothetical protein